MCSNTLSFIVTFSRLFNDVCNLNLANKNIISLLICIKGNGYLIRTVLGKQWIHAANTGSFAGVYRTTYLYSGDYRPCVDGSVFK